MTVTAILKHEYLDSPELAGLIVDGTFVKRIAIDLDTNPVVQILLRPIERPGEIATFTISKLNSRTAARKVYEALKKEELVTFIKLLAADNYKV